MGVHNQSKRPHHSPDEGLHRYEQFINAGAAQVRITSVIKLQE